MSNTASDVIEARAAVELHVGTISMEVSRFDHKGLLLVTKQFATVVVEAPYLHEIVATCCKLNITLVNTADIASVGVKECFCSETFNPVVYTLIGGMEHHALI